MLHHSTLIAEPFHRPADLRLEWWCRRMALSGASSDEVCGRVASCSLL